jgi:hypothetical protein
MDSSDVDIASKERELFFVTVQEIISIIERAVDNCKTVSGVDGVDDLRNRLDAIAYRVLEVDWDAFNVSRGLVDPLYMNWAVCCQRIGKARDALGIKEFRIYQKNAPGN